MILENVKDLPSQVMTDTHLILTPMQSQLATKITPPTAAMVAMEATETHLTPTASQVLESPNNF